MPSPRLAEENFLVKPFAEAHAVQQLILSEPETPIR